MSVDSDQPPCTGLNPICCASIDRTFQGACAFSRVQLIIQVVGSHVSDWTCTWTRHWVRATLGPSNVAVVHLRVAWVAPRRAGSLSVIRWRISFRSNLSENVGTLAVASDRSTGSTAAARAAMVSLTSSVHRAISDSRSVTTTLASRSTSPARRGQAAATIHDSLALPTRWSHHQPTTATRQRNKTTGSGS